MTNMQYDEMMNNLFNDTASLYNPHTSVNPLYGGYSIHVDSLRAHSFGWFQRPILTGSLKKPIQTIQKLLLILIIRRWIRCLVRFLMSYHQCWAQVSRNQSKRKPNLEVWRKRNRCAQSRAVVVSLAHFFLCLLVELRFFPVSFSSICYLQ